MRCGNFLPHEIYKNSMSFVEAGIGVKGQIMCIQKCLQRFPDPLAGFKRAYF